MNDLVSTLSGLSADELDRFFHESDAEEIVALACATAYWPARSRRSSWEVSG